MGVPNARQHFHNRLERELAKAAENDRETPNDQRYRELLRAARRKANGPRPLAQAIREINREGMREGP